MLFETERHAGRSGTVRNRSAIINNGHSYTLPYKIATFTKSKFFTLQVGPTTVWASGNYSIKFLIFYTQKALAMSAFCII